MRLSWSVLDQAIGESRNLMAHLEVFSPCGRDAGFAVVGSGELAADGGGGVGVVAQVDGHKNGVAEGVGLVEAPEGGFEAFDNVAAATDLIFGFVFVFSGGNRLDYGRHVLSKAAIVGAKENIFLGFAVEGLDLHVGV